MLHASRASRRRLTAAVADAAIGESGPGWARQLRSELRHVTDLPVRDLRDRADRLAREHRELDTRLQAANWAVDVLD